MDQMIPFYRERLGLGDAVFEQIVHEDSMIAVVYRVKRESGELILKICERARDYLREVYYLGHFAGRLPVPRVVGVVEPEEGVAGAVLMECLRGDLLKRSEWTDGLAFELGGLLARIHENRTVGYGDLVEPEGLSSDPSWHFRLKFDEAFEECRGHLPEALLDRCRVYFEARVGLLSGVDGPCIIHRDFRPGNVIVDGGKLQGIIDWAGARASFAEEDFCPMEHGEWTTHPASKQPFLEGYSSVRMVPDYGGIMPLLRVNRALNTIGFTVRSGTWEGRNARPYEFNRRFLEGFF